MSRTVAEIAKERYDRFRAAGSCARNGTPLTVAEKTRGNVYCTACRAYLAERARERKAGRKLREIGASGDGGTVAERTAVARKKARENGFCSTCTTRRPEPGYITCTFCIEKAANAQRRKLLKVNH